MFASLGLAALGFLGWVRVGRVLLIPPGFGDGLWAEKQPEISRAQKHCHLLTRPGALPGPGRAAGHCRGSGMQEASVLQDVGCWADVPIWQQGRSTAGRPWQAQLGQDRVFGTNVQLEAVGMEAEL